MCGIAGLVQFNTTITYSGPLAAMSQALRHRGPDDEGYIFGDARSGEYALFGGSDTPSNVFHYPRAYSPSEPLGLRALPGYTLGLLNRRLAIVDLSPAGHQPLCNEDCTLWIVYNGEIYNSAALQTELISRGHHFVSATDTEMILHAYEEWGENCVNRFNGMWAFAIWDVRQRRLLLSRDRVGIKPLYYWQETGCFAFASEIKALLVLNVPTGPDEQAVYDFLVGNLTDHRPLTFFKGIFSVPPAHTLAVDLDTGQTTLQPYWQIDLNRRLAMKTERDYVEAFYNLFQDAVRVHLISDVPVGTCLSGGLDSSSVVAVISRLIGERGLHVVGMENRQKTFSARYADFVQDEGPHIEQVVNRFDVEPYMTYPSPSTLQDEWLSLFYHLEEPFGSTSIFAQRQVFKLARQAGVTVTLDGQGGDELLAGYWGFFPYYFLDLLGEFKWGRWSREFRAHCALHGVNIGQEIRNMVSNGMPARLKLKAKSRALSRQAWLSPLFVQQAQHGAESRWDGMKAGRKQLSRRLLAALQFDPLPSLLRFDDRNSMAFSVESRVPFLDYRLIEFCFALPPEYKIRQGITKYILRQAMSDLLPAQVTARQDKIGFSTPQDRWIHTLSPWLYDVFESSEFRQRPYFQADQVLNLLDAHVAQQQNHAAVLWRCLALELWHRAMKV